MNLLKKKTMEKFLRLTLTLILVFGFCMVCPYSIVMADELEEPETPIPVDEYGTNYLLAGCAGSIQNYGGYLTCNLTETCTQCTVFASIASNNVAQGETVDCSFQFPNGSRYNLGMVPATGGLSFSINFMVLQEGEYKFVFASSTSEEIEVAGFIYE